MIDVREKTANDKCIVDITDNGSADQVSWYAVWKEVQAIVDICVKVGYIGQSSGLGESLPCDPFPICSVDRFVGEEDITDAIYIYI